MKGITQRQRRILQVLIGLFGIALLLLLFAVGSPRGVSASPVALELARTAAEFKAVLLRDWLQVPLAELADQSVTVAPSFWRLRSNLFVDSVLLVPAYVGLLVFFTLVFGPALQQQPVRRQLLCVPAVAAGLFDIAENGMTGRALDDLVHTALADPTAADVSTAARIKWLLLGLALLIVAWRVVLAAAGDAPWRIVSAVLCALAAAGCAAGGALVMEGAIHAGLLAALLGLGLLSVRLLRLPPTAPPAPGSAGFPPPRPSPPAGPPAA